MLYGSDDVYLMTDDLVMMYATDRHFWCKIVLFYKQAVREAATICPAPAS